MFNQLLLVLIFSVFWAQSSDDIIHERILIMTIRISQVLGVLFLSTAESYHVYFLLVQEMNDSEGFWRTCEWCVHMSHKILKFIQWPCWLKS